MNHESIRLPKFWVGICLLAWGAFTDQIALGIGLAVVAEFGAFSPVKWELTDKHFYRVADLTSIFFVLVAVYQFNEYSIYGIYRILALLPICVFPLLLAERYSTAGAIPLSALFLSLRRGVRHGFEPDRSIGMSFPFVIVCVLAGSAGKMPEMVYLAGAFLLIGGALFTQRARRYSLPAWAIQGSVRFTQRQIEDSFSYWVDQFAWFQTDPNRELTAIGSIGRLKLSDRIRVRVYTPLSTPLPIMLHEASYSKFDLGMWSLTDSQFTAVDPVPETSTWNLEEAPTSDGLRTARIMINHDRDVGVVPLPYGTTRIFGEEVIEVQRNQYGTTLLEALPGQLEYGAAWTNGGAGLQPPSTADLLVPKNYAEVIQQVAAEISLPTDDPRAAVEHVVRFFDMNYKYSLIQRGSHPGHTPLAHFLLNERKGHCEYFATATTLLLRQAGIPARYAVGYVVDEYSPLEEAFVGRARHAHSWTEAFVDNRWMTIDTTPSEWYGLEQARASSWQRMQDLWSWIGNRYRRFQRTDHDFFADYLIWLVPPLTLLLFWRLRAHARNMRAEPGSQPRAQTGRGLDSELFNLSRQLRDQGFTLRPGDTLRTFLVQNVDLDVGGAPLGRLLDLHYRYRFAAEDLSMDERDELRDGAEEYCQRHGTD